MADTSSETATETLHRNAPRIAAAVLAIVTLGGGAAWLSRRAVSGPTPGPAAPVTATGPVLLIDPVAVGVENLPPLVERLSGQVEALTTATVAAEVGARVVRRPIERGDRVAAGSPLILLDEAAARATLNGAMAAQAQATATRKQLEAEYARTFIETAAAIANARATLTGANAGEQRTRSLTRTQELRQAEASLSQAQTDENLAKIELDRYDRLVAEGAVAKQVLDRAQATYDAAVARRKAAEEGVSLAKEGARQEDIAQAAAQVNAARANLAAAEARPARLAALREQINALKAQEAQAGAAVDAARIALGKYRILAPFSGRVLETLIEKGEMATPGGPVARIADIRQVKAIFAVPEASRNSLRDGQRVTLTADALPHVSFSGRIARIGYEADARARTFRLEIMVENPKEVLLPNMVVRLELPGGPARRTVSLPVSAVAIEGGSPYVFLLDTGRAIRRSVTPGAPLPENRVAIMAGLNGGETVAAAPQRLTDGARVTLTTESGR